MSERDGDLRVWRPVCPCGVHDFENGVIHFLWLIKLNVVARIPDCPNDTICRHLGNVGVEFRFQWIFTFPPLLAKDNERNVAEATAGSILST